MAKYSIAMVENGSGYLFKVYSTTNNFDVPIFVCDSWDALQAYFE
jgi:hypothetical protein